MPRRARLDTEHVVQAATRLLDAEGTQALTLNRLAKDLGVQTPSLYNHVDGLPGLQRQLQRLNARLLADALTQSAIGRSGQEALLALGRAYREHIHRHPGLYMSSLISSGRQPEPDEVLEAEEARAVQVALRVLDSFGLKGEAALHAARGLRSLVHGFATLEAAGGFGLPLNLDESFERMLRTFGHALEAEA